ncbi:MAG: phosphate ABC transporter permease subunit PstC [Candidatus Omnitrophica bacterium]|jgi:phosphate transport system permease protein|nr:phosphate ABC transporter permease subunit PstC [Candidatus Omnitrophota bacterium]MDD5078627.1 phosphate ABC transporter permease subunit PstC [Candidatus Omnitrophota bacterium]MDD5724853.1 phosphate ABC transporter permease subunit PstC [Candidatus Omnitrophota bacterium]
MSRFKEKIIKWTFTVLAFASLLFLVGIMLVLFKEGLPIFRKISFFNFILGKSWYPTYSPPEFGILPLILASVWVTLGAVMVCLPLGIGSALYLNELAGPAQKAVLKPVIELLASIPSVVFGFFGMVILTPFLQKIFHLPTGLTALNASIILGIMATPTVCSIAEDALNYVPNSFREASFAVGATRWQTLTRVVIPAAGSGISTAIILGMSRAIGETMTVLMVAGGAAVIPHTFLEPVRPMTAAIAAEMGEAPMGGDHYHALFAIALILFIITFIFNIIAEMISRRFRIKLGLSG